MRKNKLWMLLAGLAVMGFIGACSPPDNSTDTVDTNLGVDYDLLLSGNYWAPANPSEELKLCFENGIDCLFACLEEIIPPEIADMLKLAHEELDACLDADEKFNFVCRREFRKARKEALSLATYEQRRDLQECLSQCGDRLWTCIINAISL